MSESEARDIASTESPLLREKAYHALDDAGELVVAYYLAYGAGWNEWHLVRTRYALERLLASAKQRSILDIYVTPQLQIRGSASKALEAQVIQVLRTTNEVLLAIPTGGHTFLENVGTCLDAFGTDEEQEVRHWFAQHAGADILAGQHPAALPDHPSVVLKACVPDPDGMIRRASF